jgi:hypothetical protein
MTPTDRCSRCNGDGIYGGKLPPDKYAGPWRWCTCPAATFRREAEPNAVEDANRVRDTLIQIGEKASKQSNLKQVVQAAEDDGYKGAF